MIAKLTVQHQVCQLERALNGVQKALEHLLDMLQFWIEHDFGLVSVTTALGPSGFHLWTARYGFLGLFFGPAGGFFFCCADHLFHADGIRASLLGTEQCQREKCQTWNSLLHQAGEKIIQTIRLRTRFRDNTLITCQQIGILIVQRMPTKECPEHLCPGDQCRRTAALFGSCRLSPSTEINQA